MHQYSLYYLLAINAMTFLLYGIDKYKAKKNNRRQAESNIKLALNIAEVRRRKTKPSMAHIRGNSAGHGCHWWQLGCMDRYACMASQDDAQKIQRMEL